ncbi:MAG: mechanosensitive ion channel, partial [Fimbriimonadaceae bacterium]|nr:mechanosensitive ion channel [Alphaproteobacteria bacterium]
ATDFYLTQLNSVLFTPLSLIVGQSAVADLLTALLLGLAFRAIRKGHLALIDPDVPKVPSQSALRWRWVQFACWVAVLAIPVAQAFGYLSLSQFIVTQLVITGIIVGALVLATMVIDEALTRGIGEGGDESLAEQIGHILGIQRTKIELTAILVNGLFKIILVIVALSFLLVPWGFESKDIFTWIRGAFFGISLGGLTFSMASIFTSILIFFAILVMTRSIQYWLENRFLPHTALDIGIRTSIKIAFGYAGFLLAFTLGLSYLGFDLSNLAIVAGALSLGIGFGLQSIVNNFVSGLILLVERPIKVGDWIVVGTDEGYVRNISVRSTEIQTFDNASVIVPNSDLISGVVTNWMHKDMKGRVRIPVGVAYDSDPVQIQDILMEIAEAHPAVLQRPQPRAYFMEFGPSSLDFELRVHLRNVDTGMIVKSELRTSILKRLREENIEIPYPQQDVHLKDIDRISKAVGEKTNKPARRKTSPKPRPAKGGA